MWNRLVWLCIAVVALAFTYYKFQLRHVTGNARWLYMLPRRRNLFNSAEVSLNAATTPISVPQTERHFLFTTSARQALAISRTTFRTIARSRGGLTLVAIMAIGTGLFATEYMQWLGVPLIARTEQVLRIITPALGSYHTQWIIIPLLTIFYAGEIIWREREAGVNELTDTTPVKESVLFLGKFLGLALVITTWVAFLLMAGIINQLVLGYYHFELGVYIRALFGIQLINYLLFALLVFVIHVLVNQKYIGHMVAFCAYGYLLFASMIGLEHNMLIYASDTGWSYSDMRGFGPFIGPWLWFKFYWASWAFLMALVGICCWMRSREGGIRTRLHLAQQRFNAHKSAFIVALVLVIASGSFIFYNTNVLNPYVTKADRMEIRAAYERRYGQFRHATRPVLERTQLHVEIYPDRQEADIRATYFLVNRSSDVIDSLHLSTIPHGGITNVSFNRKATGVIVDKGLGYQVYALEKSLMPGDSVQMRFDVHVGSRGFSNQGVDASVVSNGTHITSEEWMPVIGYDDDRQLRDARDREKHGLHPQVARPGLHDVEARYDTRHAEQMYFEAVVGTSADQTAVAPGALRRSWKTGGRQYFHYVTNAPIHNEFAFFSANYKLREAKWIPVSHVTTDSFNASEAAVKPVTIQIFHHPAHDVNIERMLHSVKASLAYYTKEFGPYPYSYFRVLERPGAGRGMHAAPMTIDYQEGYSLMKPGPHGPDLPYHIMSHEVAHMWWGFTLSPAAVEGAGLLVESFATYSAMQVVEETLGYDHLLQYLSQMRMEYEVPRSRAAPPLLRANNAFMNYRKGPFALFAMRHYIGKNRVNDALRQMVHKHTTGPPLPTTLDFYRELQAVTPDSLQYLVHDLFAANTFWELKTEKATTKQTGSGTWEVTLEVMARKVVVDETGREKEIPMNDWIEIGVYANTVEREADSLVYGQKHRVHSGRQTIRVTVPRKPSRAGIDPGHLLIDLEMGDNVRKIQ